MRNDIKHPESWGLPGGKCEEGETLMTTIYRECSEELGFMPEYIKLSPVEQFTTLDAHFVYHTFFCSVEREFKPVLNNEHLGYAWIDKGIIPKFLHPGLFNTVKIKEIQEKILQLESIH